jgi:chromosome segregation ATPase
VLIATFITLLLMPFYRARTRRLTERHLKQSMPLTEAEIAADKDRLRADYAIKVHKLEAKVEQAELAAARQQIELNRRDAAISALEGQIGTLRSSLEEHENARRVLEQTITDRFPRVELRLNEAKKLLFQRDREIQSLSDTASRQAKALEEAAHVNTQQRDEVLRLNNALQVRAARSRDGIVDPKFEAEVALRSELEELRARSREQAATIARLQAGGDMEANGVAASGGAIARAHGNGAEPAATAETVDLRRRLAEAEAALRQLKSEADTRESGKSELEAQLRRHKASIEDQATELAKLKAELATFAQAGEERSLAIKDSRLALKARLQSLQAENEAQAATIQKMRAEIAAANERLARQAAHFMDEMRRLGSGALPASGPSRKPEPQRRPLAERITGPKAPPAPAPAPVAAEAPSDPSRVSGFLRALGGGSARPGEAQPAMADPETHIPAAASPPPPSGSPGGAESNGPDQGRAPRKGRLLERITSVAKG